MADPIQSCPRRRWGKTDLSIPVIPFGTQGFGNHFGAVTQEEAFELVRRAVDLGVNHFDCARCYGDSLGKLGVAIKQRVIGRDEIIISGRICCHSGAIWGGYGDGDPDYSSLRVLADVEDQLEILGVDYFDVLLLHDPLAIGPTLAVEGTLAGLERARQRGQVRWIGYGMRPHEFHRAAIASGRVDALLTFCDHNLLRQTAGEGLLVEASARDIGVLNGWSIMRGLLTGRRIEEVVARDKWNGDHERAEAMRLWCEQRGVSLLQLALQFCLRDQRIHGNPVGNLNIAQLEMNARAAATPIADDVMAEFESADL